MTDLRWIIVMAYSGAEWNSNVSLLRRGIETYYPFEIVDARRGRWIQGSVKAIYPGYLFAGLTIEQSTDRVLETPGVAGVIRNGRELVVVPESQISQIKLACSAMYRASLPHRLDLHKWRIGEVITVPYGALMGLPAIITAIDKSGRISATLGNLDVTFPVGALHESVRSGALHGARAPRLSRNLHKIGASPQ